MVPFEIAVSFYIKTKILELMERFFNDSSVENEDSSIEK